jgi:NTE family protein
MDATVKAGSQFQRADRVTLTDALRAKFGVDLDGLDAKFELLVLGPKELLFEQGDRSQDVYVVLSGRLRAFRKTSHGVENLNEIGRGETVGELAFLLNIPRSASVTAIREARVARFSRAAFEAFLARKPQLATAVMRLAIQRFRNTETMRPAVSPPAVIAVVKASPRIDLDAFVRRLAHARSIFGGPSVIMTGADIPGAEAADSDFYAPGGSASGFLNERAAASETLFLAVDGEPSPFAELCLEIADEILLVASDSDPPRKSATETQIIDGDASFPRANQTLVLLHPLGCARPCATAEWLARRDVQRHFHVREDVDRDWTRLARILAGRAVGLVLSGGGARGLTEIGVLQALCAAGVDPDYVGGTSIGAIISALDAIEIRGAALFEAGKAAFKRNVTNDYNIMPIISLIKGIKVQNCVRNIIKSTVGSEDMCSEDTWKAHFCIGSNYTTACEVVLRHGLLWRNLVASAAIPGVFPPQIIDGGVIFDGGTFNNFPVDVMEQQGPSYIIGVDMLVENDTSTDLNRAPNSGRVLFDRWKRNRPQKYEFPLLHETLLSATFLGSHAKQRSMRAKVDLHIAPKVEGIGWFDWSRYEEIVQIGYETALRQIEKLEPGQLARIQVG